MVVVFDFDKTLVAKDSGFRFYVFCAAHRGWRITLVPLYVIAMVLRKLGVMSLVSEKIFGLRLFCPRDYDRFKWIAREFSRVYLLKELNAIYFRELLPFVRDGFRVIVVSASFKDYLEPLFSGVEVIGTECCVNSGGRISGLGFHAYGADKVVGLNKIGVKFVDRFYTDSIADMPVSLISGETIWIKRGKIDRIDKNTNL